MTKHVFNKQWIVLPATAMAVAAISAGCGSATTASSSGFTVSGTLNTGSSSGGNDEIGRIQALAANRTSLTAYDVRCVTLSGSVQSCDGTCDSGGNFSCGPLPTGTPFGCFVEQSGSIVAVMAFAGSTTGLNGSSTSQGSIVAGGGTTGLSLGTVSLNVSTGTAVVSMANVQATGGSAPASTNTGVSTFANLEDQNGWTIHAITDGSSLPPGVTTAVTGCTSNCDGPGDGQIIFLAQYQATDSSGNTHVGLSIWNGGSSASTASTFYNACMASGHGEGATNLASNGMTAVAGPNNNAAQLTGTLGLTTALPNPANVPASPVCGITGSVSNRNCSHASLSAAAGYNPTSWGFPSGSVGDDQCTFLCTLNNIGQANQSSGCGANVNVNWGVINGSGSGQSSLFNSNFDPQYSGSTWSDHGSDDVSFAAAGSPPQGVAASYLNGGVAFSGSSPSNRFMFGELIVSAGGIGTLSNSQSYTQTICASGGNSGCTAQTTCHITEVDQITITETASSGGNATAAVVQLVQNRVSDQTQDEPVCLTGSDASMGKQMFQFNITAN